LTHLLASFSTAINQSTAHWQLTII